MTGRPLGTEDLGWLVPWGTPVTLPGSWAQVRAARRDPARIGIVRLAAVACGDPAQWAAGAALRSYPVADFRVVAATVGPETEP